MNESKVWRYQLALTSIMTETERKIDELFSYRHDYPVWPPGNLPLDTFERTMYDPARTTYYDFIRYMVNQLRSLRELSKL